MPALTEAQRGQLLAELAHARTGEGLAPDYIGEASEFSPSCGDTITVRVDHEGFTWSAHGCTVSIAAASALGTIRPTEFADLVAPYFASIVPGAPAVAGILEPFAGIGRYPLRARCATLAWRAAERALEAR